jgi:hypothetical protein
MVDAPIKNLIVDGSVDHREDKEKPDIENLK